MRNEQFEFDKDKVLKMGKDNYILPEKLDPTVTGRKRKVLHVQHKEALNWMLKAVDVAPIGKTLKMILRLRLWGKDPNVFCPLTIKQIAFITQTREETVEAMEAEAKERLHDYIKRFHLGDIIGQFNKAKMGGNVLTDSKGRPITS